MTKTKYNELVNHLATAIRHDDYPDLVITCTPMEYIVELELHSGWGLDDEAERRAVGEMALKDAAGMKRLLSALARTAKEKALSKGTLKIYKDEEIIFARLCAKR